MIKKPKKYDDDDGRVICNMDIAGMRTHAKRDRKVNFEALTRGQGGQFSRLEALRYTWYSVLAGLVIVLVFSVTLILFTLFCIQIWFN